MTKAKKETKGAAQARPKRRKKWTPDFGSLADWRTRVKGTMVYYKNSAFYVADVYQQENAELTALHKKRGKLMDAIYGAKTIEEQQRHENEIHNVIDPEIIRLEEEDSTSKTGIRIRGTVYTLSKKGDITHKQISDLLPKALSYEMKQIGFVNLERKRPNKMGQVELSSEAVYTSRKAHRQYNHGLCRVNVKFSSKYQDTDVTSDSFVRNSMLHDFPSLESCLDYLFELEGDNSKAFSLDFAVKVDAIGHVSLIYRDRVVGMSEDDGDSFRLAGKYRYLEETLIDHGVEIVGKEKAAA